MPRPTVWLMWHVIVPVKSWDAAKSRLALTPDQRRAIARAMTADTLAAVAACDAVNNLTVLTNDEAMAASPELALATDVLVQPDQLPQLDAALAWAAQQSAHTHQGVAVLVADLPALTPAALALALDAAAAHQTAMATDRHGTGTTLLTAVSGSTLTPRFGTDSARRHLDAGVLQLDPTDVSAALACDVDTVEDLGVARSLGLGPNSAMVDASLGSPP